MYLLDAQGKPITDGLRSMISGLGYASRDKSETVEYFHRQLSMDQLVAAYQNSWIARKVCEIPADDAVRKWREWHAESADITQIEKYEKRLGVKLKAHQALVWARLWGGSAIVIGMKDQSDMMEPLDPERVKRDDLQYLAVLSRNDISSGELEMDVTSEYYGRPKYYELNRTNGAQVRIHPSRMVIFIGDLPADQWRTSDANSGWGTSVIQTVYTAMRNTDAAQANAAALIFEACVDVFGIPEMMSHMGNAEYEKRFLDRMELAAVGKSVTRSLIMDAAETFNRKQITFGSIPELLETFLLTVSGAADIPMTRFIGQSPAGLSSTGEGDMKNYHDRISSMQTLKIEPAMWRLDECLIRSALGSRSDDIWYDWCPLEQMSEKERAEIGKMTAETVNLIAGLNVYTPEEILQVSTNAFAESGVFPGIDAIVKQTPEADRDKLQSLEAGETEESTQEGGSATAD